MPSLTKEVTALVNLVNEVTALTKETTALTIKDQASAKLVPNFLRSRILSLYFFEKVTALTSSVSTKCQKEVL